MHAKSDSEVTSLAPSSPPRSPRRPIYYVMSPSQHETEKMSMGSSPPGSPYHHHGHQVHHPHHHRYASSPIHHSRESSTTRFSASLRNGPWRKFPYARGGLDEEDEDEDQGDDAGRGLPPRCYAAFFLLGFVLLFTFFSLVLWGASKAYRPDIFVKSVVFESYNLHPGMDRTGVPTKMLCINSTVKVSFRNPATFFGVHVSATLLEFYYYDLVIASGNMKEFYQSRKSQRVVTVRVGAEQVPVYGGGSSFTSVVDGQPAANIPLNLTFAMRARAHVLGKLVKSKFYRRIRCSLALREAHLGKPLDLASSCVYRS